VGTSRTRGAPSTALLMILQASHQHVRKELGRTSQQLTDSIASVGGLDEDLAAAKAKYTYMQEVRGYIADLCDMLQVRPCAAAGLCAACVRVLRASQMGTERRCMAASLHVLTMQVGRESSASTCSRLR